jgi:hypothetical protein
MEQCPTRIRQFIIMQANKSPACSRNIFASTDAKDRRLSEHSAMSTFAANAQTLSRVLNHRDGGCGSDVANFAHSGRQAKQMMGDNTERTIGEGSCECFWMKPQCTRFDVTQSHPKPGSGNGRRY